MKILYKKKFIKAYRNFSPSIQQKIDTAISLFHQNPQHPKLRNHALKGTYFGLRSLNVTGDIRILFRKLSHTTYEIVEMIDIGTHSKFY